MRKSGTPQTAVDAVALVRRPACLRRRVRGLLCFVFLLRAISVILSAAELTVLSPVRLLADAHNDGDSFAVEADGKRYRLRLYFVDCAEISAATKSDAARLREQRRYFGLTDAERVVFYGRQAKQVAEELLAEPFAVHTAFASALGRTAAGRVYAFVTSSDGRDLATELVRRGLARTLGIGRKTPDGVPRDEMKERLRDLELAAALRRVGIWAESDPERIAELRADQRREDNELRQVQNAVKGTSLPVGPFDLNTCSRAELESVPGIGPVTAALIMEGRPFRSVDELAGVKKIGAAKLAKLRPFFTVD